MGAIALKLNSDTYLLHKHTDLTYGESVGIAARSIVHGFEKRFKNISNKGLTIWLPYVTL